MVVGLGIFGSCIVVDRRLVIYVRHIRYYAVDEGHGLFWASHRLAGNGYVGMADRERLQSICNRIIIVRNPCPLRGKDGMRVGIFPMLPGMPDRHTPYSLRILCVLMRLTGFNLKRHNYTMTNNFLDIVRHCGYYQTVRSVL